ncbi:substrate-binding domain-containing protein [Caulobacter sp.]|uniref:substrate-binding domain-containing protein n=1 Tax=Caulobacter sp. TaxID=78 RepID=UPI003BB06980
MSKLKLRALLGVSILAASAALAASASAGEIYGGGSSLIAPYWRQLGDCYGTDEQTFASGTTPVLEVVVSSVCGSPLTSDTVGYISTGSGTGLTSIGTHNPSSLGDTFDNAATSADDTTVNLFPRVSYALSENALTAANVNAYNNGGSFGSATVPTGGIDQIYGKVVQFPVAVAPVAIAFDPVYKKTADATGAVTSYSLQFGTASGKLELSREAYCKIFNGEITDWNDPILSALGVSGDPTDPAAFTAPITLAGRRDSSGTSGLFTRHLASICGPLATTNRYNDGGSTLLSALTAAGKIALIDADNNGVADFVYNKALGNRTVLGTPGFYVVADGSDGVAKYLAFSENPAANATLTQARVGYVGNDYTLPGSANSGFNFNLQAAVLENKNAVYFEPTPDNATLAFSASAPPALADRADPTKWAQPATKAAPLADPDDGYPIIGTVNWVSYSCYANASDVAVITNSGSGILDLLNDPLVADPSTGILPRVGLAAIPSDWFSAISETFLDQTDPQGLGLTISPVGGSATNAACSSLAGA